MKQNERAIVRKRTQQLVYLELGRNNGGVMLNLSEDGCGFQAISPVERGMTRFAFQISGGRRIAGEGEVEWTDGVGITGGLRFLDLSVEARQQIRIWLADTNAPEEPGEGVLPVTVTASGTAGSAESMGQRELRQNATSRASTRVMEAEAPVAPPWSHIPIESLPILENERARFPLLREDGSFGAQARSAAVWRGIASVTTVAALAALIAVYQREVGNSLIWLGETLTGRTKASVVVPEGRPAGVADSSTNVNTAATGIKTTQDAVPKDGPALEQQEAPKAPERTREEQYPAKTDAVMRSAERPESMLEQQAVRQDVEKRYEGETVQSLWDAVQAGSVSAEMSLAERFARGEGVVRNCDQARVLLKAAANKGNRDARLRLYQLESGGCQ